MYKLTNTSEKLNPYLKYILFIYLFTVFSGAFRKWFNLSKEIGNIILFLQLLVPFSLFLIRGGMKKWTIGVPLFIFLLFVLGLGVLNPLNLTVNHGVLGFLIHFSFFFLLFFYLNNRDKFNFGKIIDILVIIGFAQLILVFFQYTQPPDSFINRYADVEAVGSIAIVGNSARVTGTFSYISGFTGFLFFHSFLVWAMIKYRYKSVYTLILLSIGLVACFMSGARAATYLYLILFGLILFVEYNSLSKVFFDFKLFIPTVLIILVFLAVGSEKFTDLVQNAFTGFIERRNRGIDEGEENQRIIGDFIQLINFRGNYPVLGVGLGSTYQGANKLFGLSPYVIEYGFFESELTRIVLEGGFLLLFTRISVMIYLFRQLTIPVLGKITILLLILFFLPIVFNVYNAVFSALGIMLVDNFYYYEKMNNIFSIRSRYNIKTGSPNKINFL
ncbi:MAG: hypothetical protein Q8K64_05575 [Sediminibacterium sp.]|nr:hypothetical protein [Sediminibacterium sp.]